MRIWKCIFSLLFVVIVSASFAQVYVSVSLAPPELPVYEQPLCPGEGYIWTPGYWAYGPEGFFWVPGTWVQPPEVGFLWTPGWWGWGDGVYLWHAGYWGPQVGFYGGIDYGYGYTGNGYQGGYWHDHDFYYNRSVNNVTNVRNVYNTTIVNNTSITRVSYNGGQGGTNARPSPTEEAAVRQRHVGLTSVQSQHQQAASSDRELFASVNHGKPAVAATPKPGELRGSGVMPARTGTPYNPAPNSAQPRPDNNPAARTDRQPAAPQRATPNNPPRNEAPRPPSGARDNPPPPNGEARPENNAPERATPNNAPRNQPGNPPQPAPRPDHAPAPNNRPQQNARPETQAPRPSTPRPETQAAPHNQQPNPQQPAPRPENQKEKPPTKPPEDRQN